MLSVSPPLLGVSVPPARSDRWSLLLSLVTLLEETSGLLSSGGESTELSVSLLGGDDPVDAWVSSDGLVGWIDKDDFVELEGGVLTNPVGVENTEVGALASNSLLSNRLVSDGLLQLADTHVSWLSVDASLGDVSLTATSADTGSVDDESLLSLVSELACLLWSGWTAALVDGSELSKLPGTHSKHEADKVGLLLSPKLLEVFVGSHV